MEKNKIIYRTGGGISFTGMLAILFIGLKLTNYITWPWLWVLSPLWIPLCILFAFIALMTLLAVVYLGIVLIATKK